MQKDQQSSAPLQYTIQQIMQALGTEERSYSTSEASKINATQNGRGSDEGGEVIKLLAKSIAVEVVELLDVPEALLDTNALAKHLGVSSSTVERLSRNGTIPRVRIGDLNRYSPSKVIKALRTSQLGGLR